MRQRNFRRSLLDLIAIAGLIFLLSLVGCPDDDGGDGDFEPVQPNNLENRTFTFPDGGAFGIPDGQAFTLEFGDFDDDGDTDPNTGPVTLASGGNEASGEVLIASCTFGFDESDFEEGEGPQDGEEFFFDPCEIDDEGRLRLTDEDGNEFTSNPTTGATGGTGTGGS